MKILKTPDEARSLVWGLRSAGDRVGVVPTMGALHDGHLSLVRESSKRCEHTVATIFVNPTQFAPHEDLGQYPRTMDQDLAGLERAGATAVLVPSAEAIYPPGYSTSVNPPAIASLLEGLHRPAHFEGVATIVLKLFQMIPASHAFFGQKDFQQWRVIEAMVRDLNVCIEVVGCPIVREPDGLAMSSRNRYLTTEQRTRALRLSQSLEVAAGQLASGETKTQRIEAAMNQTLLGSGGVDSVDYAKVVDAYTLQDTDVVDGPVVALVAAMLGKTRLIDNRLL